MGKCQPLWNKNSIWSKYHSTILVCSNRICVIGAFIVCIIWNAIFLSPLNGCLLHIYLLHICWCSFSDTMNRMLHNANFYKLTIISEYIRNVMWKIAGLLKLLNLTATPIKGTELLSLLKVIQLGKNKYTYSLFGGYDVYNIDYLFLGREVFN